MTPKISVIVPCYNQAQYLDECLQSVLDQTFQDWECIIVNDGSPDNTAEIAAVWVAKDNRFKYIYKQNGGLSSARNAGLTVITGDYIQFLDCDDTINKFKFEKQLAYFQIDIEIVICDYFPYNNETGAFSRIRYMNPFPSKNNFKQDIISRWEKSLSIPCHSILFKSKILTENSFLNFDESLPNHEDWLFWVKLFNYAKGLCNIEDCLANYRIHDKSLCSDEVKMKIGFLEACKSVCNFFEIEGNKKQLKLSLEKYDNIQGKKSFNFKNVLILFIPPIFFHIRKRVVNL